MSGLTTRVCRDGFEIGSPELDSVGPITFSPDGVLFVADNARTQILALDLADDEPETSVPHVENLDERLAAFTGCNREDIAIRGLCVHPVSQAVYLSVMRGAGDAAAPLVIRVAGDGALAEVELENVPYARTVIENAPAEDDERQDGRVLRKGDMRGEALVVNETMTLYIDRWPLRTSTVTDLAFVDGELLVAGASNEEFVSTLRRIPFPFGGETASTTLEIYHVVHDKWETEAPIRTFAPYCDGSGILASYTCTPVVHFDLADLVDGRRAVGRTVAEFGGANTPIDIVPFMSEGQEFVLVSSSRYPLFKLDRRDIDAQEALVEHKQPRETGVPREELPQKDVSLMGVVGDRVLMLHEDDAGYHLRSYDSASL
jgi:hypothetical protein